MGQTINYYKRKLLKLISIFALRGTKKNMLLFLYLLSHLKIFMSRRRTIQLYQLEYYSLGTIKSIMIFPKIFDKHLGRDTDLCPAVIFRTTCLKLYKSGTSRSKSPIILAELTPIAFLWLTINTQVPRERLENGLSLGRCFQGPAVPQLLHRWQKKKKHWFCFRSWRIELWDIKGINGKAIVSFESQEHVPYWQKNSIKYKL